MTLLRTVSMIETAERHVSSLPDTNLDKTEIANYLGSVAAVIFYSEMEEQVQAVVKSRLTGFSDERLQKFVFETHAGMLKRMKRKDIVDTVGLFGDDCKEVFRQIVPEEDLARYNNVIGERHLTSHGVGSYVTLTEVRQAADAGEKILKAIEVSIA